MTTKPYAGIKIEPGRIRALAYLRTHLAGLLDGGEIVPCCTSASPLWISADSVEQTIAAAECGTCPALDRCRSYVEQWPEAGGVWAGQTEQDRRPPGRPRKEAS